MTCEATQANVDAVVRAVNAAGCTAEQFAANAHKAAITLEDAYRAVFARREKEGK